jgi:hypothetical protein
MMTTLKVEISLPQGDLEEFWKLSAQFGESELGMPVERRDVIKIDGELMANRELGIWSNLMAGIAVGDVMKQADEILNARGAII